MLNSHDTWYGRKMSNTLIFPDVKKSGLLNFISRKVNWKRLFERNGEKCIATLLKTGKYIMKILSFLNAGHVGVWAKWYDTVLITKLFTTWGDTKVYDKIINTGNQYKTENAKNILLIAPYFILGSWQLFSSLLTGIHLSLDSQTFIRGDLRSFVSSCSIILWFLQ